MAAALATVAGWAAWAAWATESAWVRSPAGGMSARTAGSDATLWPSSGTGRLTLPEPEPTAAFASLP